MAASPAVPPAVAARWYERVRFFNAYGPTEATIAATGWELPDDTHTVVEVKCPDRVGLLYAITRTLSEQSGAPLDRAGR